MANRYWVGGTAAWDGTAGTKWALTSGGAGGQAVPTTSDDVFFDAASGAVTCTISTGNVGAKSITCTGFTGTLAGTAGLTVLGSITLDAGMTVTYTGTIIMNGTGTLTTAGKTLASVEITTGTPVVTLGSALTLSNILRVNSGTFNTSNYNITASQIISVAGTRTINLGSSTLTLSGTAAFNLAGALAGLTLNAGTSTINVTASDGQISTSAQLTPSFTFYNVNFTSTTTGTRIISGAFTFNNLTITGPASTATDHMAITGPQTINGTLSTTGTAGNRRVLFRSSDYGIAQTLTIANTSLSDTDFRDLYVIGAAAPISGTRIGNHGGCLGITFSTPKNVYWGVSVISGSYTWDGSAQWALSAGGAESADNYPLAQDTVFFYKSYGTATIYTRAVALPNINASAATIIFSRTFGSSDINTNAFHGTQFILGAGVTFDAASAALMCANRGTTTITSAGKTLPFGITVNTFGGTVQLADALNIGTQPITVTNGTFDTKNYAVTSGSINSNNLNVRSIKFGSSTVSCFASFDFTNTTNFSFDAGTSSIILTANFPVLTIGPNDPVGLTFYNVTATATLSIRGVNTFNNLTVTAPSSTGINFLRLNANQTINGTLTVAGATRIRRVFVQSSDSANNPIAGTKRYLTINTLVADHCDFCDIEILGSAIGTAPTGAGDCGNNVGITFPSPKTVYWNLSGTQNWSATAWATSSGGTPDISNFPLAQDTAVFDDAGIVGTVGINNGFNVGTVDASTRTSAMTIYPSTSFSIYGDWKFGTGVTQLTTSNIVTFQKNGIQTITSNGVQFKHPIAINNTLGCTVQLADAITVDVIRKITLTAGTFDAVSYNVTTGVFDNASTTNVLKMGSGTWTILDQGTGWSLAILPILYVGTSTIVLSSTIATSRTFAGGGGYYNKLTIGGATGSGSTLTITGTNTFGELASTKTIAHTIALGSAAQTIGKWTVTGTVGNVVTVTGTAVLTIAGARVSGVDYLAMGTISLSTTSPGEFYAGANSTGTGAGITLTAAPAPVTRYWVGGTGTWNATTTNWSDTSGGSGGFSVPTSADAVIFNSASNATAYTVTISTVSARCAALTLSGPTSGNLTINSSTNIPLNIHGNVTFAATGVVSSSMSGGIVLSGSLTGKTFTTNGVALTAQTDVIKINGVGCGWTLGNATNLGINAGINVVNGSFSTANYSVTAAYLNATGSNITSMSLGSSTVTLSGFTNAIGFGTTAAQTANFIFDSGTSTINFATSNSTLNCNGNTFYNVSILSTVITLTLNGSNTFNNFSVSGRTSAGLTNTILAGNQTINGTLTLSAGTDATTRTFVRSDTIGTTRNLTVGTFAAGSADIDFRDITIAGAAAPISGTRFGDCKGNSGITFDAAKTVYTCNAGDNNWNTAGVWSTNPAGPGNSGLYLPLAQDIAIVQASTPPSAATLTINAAYNIGTIDMSARTANTMTLATGSSPTIYGDWINGTGITISGTPTITFAGRTAQSITSAGKTFTQSLTFNSPGGTVTLQDSLTISRADTLVFWLVAGTFNANNYNVSLTATTNGRMSSDGTIPRTLAMGSGTWTLAASGTPWSATNSLTVTGTGTISLTSASAKTFAGGGVNYSGITINQGGAGALTFGGNNILKTITNTYAAIGATSISLAATIQTFTSAFTASGTLGKLLSITGTSGNPATLIFNGSGNGANVDYLSITNIRAYPLVSSWYAGANSSNFGSLGWLFSAAPIITTNYGGNFFVFF